MAPDVTIDVFRQALYLTAIMVIVLTGPSLIVGLVIAIFQAATQVNEMSLSFIPKLLVTFATFFFMGPWLLNQLLDFTQHLFLDLPGFVG